MGHWQDDAARGLAAGPFNRRDVMRRGVVAGSAGGLIAGLMPFQLSFSRSSAKTTRACPIAGTGDRTTSLSVQAWVATSHAESTLQLAIRRTASSFVAVNFTRPGGESDARCCRTRTEVDLVDAKEG